MSADDEALVRVFTVTHDNSKRKKPGTPLHSYSSTGIIFLEDGHVALNTSAVAPCYRSLQKMIEKLTWWGKCEIEGLDDLLGLEDEEE